MTWAYYNEFEPYCAQWLRNLIAAGHIASGEVDERDIREVNGNDLEGFGQVHFFAGIGGWAYAARLAGIPDDQPLWTGSCPCQPLSSAGQRKGHADERHLWPAFQSLIAERRPAKVFGEQVASKDGREWLAGVRADLEDLGYAVGAADLPAASVGAPHARQRLWWYADNNCDKYFGKIQPSATNPINENWKISEAFQIKHRRFLELVAMDVGETYLNSYTATRRMVHGIHDRLGRLRAYGNAINPQVAAEFMRCCP